MCVVFFWMIGIGIVKVFLKCELKCLVRLWVSFMCCFWLLLIGMMFVW